MNADLKEEKSNVWSKEFPTVMGWYWMRGFRQYRTLPVEVNGSKFSMMFGVGLYDAEDAAEAEFTGPITPSDTEELFALREAARAALESIPRLMGVLFREDHRGLAADSQRTYDLLRAALLPHQQEQEGKHPKD